MNGWSYLLFSPNLHRVALLILINILRFKTYVWNKFDYAVVENIGVFFNYFILFFFFFVVVWLVFSSSRLLKKMYLTHKKGSKIDVWSWVYFNKSILSGWVGVCFTVFFCLFCICWIFCLFVFVFSSKNGVGSGVSFSTFSGDIFCFKFLGFAFVVVIVLNYLIKGCLRLGWGPLAWEQEHLSVMRGN